MLQTTQGIYKVSERPMLLMPSGSPAPIHVNDAAYEASGSGQDYSIWPGRPEHPERYALIELQSSMIDYLAASNAQVIKDILNDNDRFDGENAWVESFGGGMSNWCEVLVVRIWDDKRTVSNVFLDLMEIKGRLDTYPVLDEDDYSQRCFDATAEQVEDQGRGICNRDLAPQDWAAEVIRWCHNEWPNIDHSQPDGSDWFTEEEVALALIDMEWGDMEEIGWIVEGLNRSNKTRELDRNEKRLLRVFEVYLRKEVVKIFQSCQVIDPLERILDEIDRFHEDMETPPVDRNEEIELSEIMGWVGIIIEQDETALEHGLDEENAIYVEAELTAFRFIQREMEKLGIEETSDDNS